MHGTNKISDYETDQKHIKFQQNLKRIFTWLKENLDAVHRQKMKKIVTTPSIEMKFQIL